jgi:hypothetical protein
MNDRLHVLRQLIRDGLYVVDGQSVANAVLARAHVRAAMADPTFRSDQRSPVARSFRRDRDARSFRLTGGVRLRATHSHC